VPLLPFGLRKYDEGERFDLRSPYADDGWVVSDNNSVVHLACCREKHLERAQFMLL
jgi:hypothetical protein